MSERLDNSHKPKRVWITILLAMIFPGAGHLYLERYKRGIVMMALVLVSSIIPAIMLGIMYGAEMEPDIPSALMEETIAVLVVAAVFLLPIGLGIWQIVDAYKICKRYNSI